MSEALLRARIDALEEENDILREEVEQLRSDVFGLGYVPPLEFGLTSAEAAILAALLRREHCSKEFLHAATVGVDGFAKSQMKIVDVYICKMRRKLEPFGIEIRTLWGRGYQLSGESRMQLNAQKSPGAIR